MYTLIIGNYNYSSWSLRAWLHLRESKDVKFSVVRIPLYTDSYKEKLLEESPAGRVPVLIDPSLGSRESSSVWDSLSIMEHILDKEPGAVGWPTQSTAAKAHARSISMEMHSGFLSIRDELPQNLRMRKKLNPEQLSESCLQQIDRMDEIWKTCYTSYGGQKWLFGDNMTIADIMFAPVALRFVTYGIQVSSESQKFVDAVVENPYVQEWIAAAKDETESIDFVDNLVPAAESPLIL